MYKIGKLYINIKHRYGDQSLKRLVPFRIFASSPDIEYQILYQDAIALPAVHNIIYQNSDIIVAAAQNSTQYFHIFQHIPYALTEEYSFSQYTITLPRDSLNYPLHPYLLPDLLHLERGLITKDCFVLHSAYVATEEGAILFTAPSGGGKTTQAKLWETHKGARIINGDKSIIGREWNNWFVYGLPFSGSSQYCLNEMHPLKAIVILDKGIKNQLLYVGLHGFPRILSQTVINPWDKVFCKAVINLITDVCALIPVYYYACTKEPEAVEVLYQELFRKGDHHGTLK